MYIYIRNNHLHMKEVEMTALEMRYTYAKNYKTGISMMAYVIMMTTKADVAYMLLLLPAIFPHLPSFIFGTVISQHIHGTLKDCYSK